jgi:hypothetical protein
MLHFRPLLKWSGDGPRLVRRDREQANRETEQKTGVSRDAEREAAQQPCSFSRAVRRVPDASASPLRGVSRLTSETPDGLCRFPDLNSK